MAGRLEEVINNKFYFVLDEVGASDCESELGSENSIKEVNNLNSNAELSFPNNVEDSDTKNQNIGSPNLLNAAKTVRDSSKTEDNEKHSCMVESAPSKSSNTAEMSEESKVVDMDIDSDGGYIDSPTPNGEPLARITFRDHSAEKLIKSPLIKFFNQKFETHIVISSDNSKLELKVYEKNSIKFLKNDSITFDLDTTPTHGSYSDVPHYGKNHNLFLSDKNLEESESPKKLFVPFKGTCFNCLKNHNLKDCTEVKDFRTISKNRLKFQKEQKMFQISRYHLDEAQKFSDIQPGIISKKLRNALNLHSDQIPRFIYRMRLLGYPPAWLEEAKVSHSGLAIYDSKGSPVLEDDEEEGEIISEGSKDKFDITKIIEFPGFNVPLPHNYKEEAKFHGCPEISKEQSKENLINLLKPKSVQAYVKKSLVLTKLDEQAESMSSPTIEEMEEKKRQLLMELNDEESGSASKLNSENSPSDTGMDSEPTHGVQGNEPGTIRNSEFGTPILKSFSPFSKLPSREQFSVNVSEVINFENLPYSTGKYETMRHVIKKIRTSAAKAQNNQISFDV